VKFLSDKSVYNAVLIDKISSKQQYSHFILNNLNNYIDKAYCLIIQFDGYVINPELWDNDWLQYDYIGAPWWYTNNYNVGNGGFSLRSKKLLQVCQNTKFVSNHPEDDIICRGSRSLFESVHNIKYAPESVAAAFSFEPNGKYSIFNNNTFGFHGIPDLILK
jgi:hypothetical protein